MASIISASLFPEIYYITHTSTFLGAGTIRLTCACLETRDREDMLLFRVFEKSQGTTPNTTV
jgi:hypothetical protein